MSCNLGSQTETGTSCSYPNHSSQRYRTSRRPPMALTSKMRLNDLAELTAQGQGLLSNGIGHPSFHAEASED